MSAFKKYMVIFTIFTFTFHFSSIILYTNSAIAKPQSKKTKNKSSGKVSGKSNLQKRIDFGNSYIMGQTIKSGAVYLLQRKKSEIKSMLKYRENYREEILEDFKIHDMTIKKSK